MKDGLMIGVFDSGSGGLTVLRALAARLPAHDFLYLGDHANAPYGTRSSEDVYRLSQVAVDFLLAQGCRLIVIACNTAAAVALRRMQQTWLPRHAPDARVLGVHVPLVETITGRVWRAQDKPVVNTRMAERTIAIFATPRTVATGSFPTEIAARAPGITVLQQACPGLAEAIEDHAGDAALQSLVDGYVHAVLAQPEAARLSAAVLACTHYPFVESQFRAALPAHVSLLTQPEMVATALEEYLRRHPEFDHGQGTGRLKLLTTGAPARLNGLASRLPPELRQFLQIALQAPSPVAQSSAPDAADPGCAPPSTA